MKEQLFVFIGGSDEQNGDYSRVHRLARGNGTARWSSMKTAHLGDRVLIYIQRPHSALVAKAEVLGTPEKGRPGGYAYRAQVGRFELLPNRVSLVDLKREFPRWAWLNYPRGGMRVPEPLADQLWHFVHEKQSRVQILMKSAGVGQTQLRRLAASGKTVWGWAPKLTAAGDTVLFYISEPISAIAAVGTAMSATRPGAGKWYEAKVGKVRILDAPITLAELRAMFPDWAWLKSVNMFAYVSPDRSKRLLKRIAEKTADAVWQQSRSVGAGFGNAETNRLVERAAVNKVWRHLRAQGYRVTSREKECINYDLDAIKGSRTLHVEVKGVSGGALQFPITAGEVRCAKEDTAFRLFVVTHATSGRSARLNPFGGRQLLARFGLTPLSYIAKAL